MIDAVLPKKLTSFHAAQGVHRSGVSSTVVLELNEEPPAPESNLLNVAPVDQKGTQEDVGDGCWAGSYIRS